jgi:hypothetical protein
VAHGARESPTPFDVRSADFNFDGGKTVILTEPKMDKFTKKILPRVSLLVDAHDMRETPPNDLHRSKLSAADIAKIFRLRRGPEPMSLPALGRRFGCSSKQIGIVLKKFSHEFPEISQ